MTPLILTPEAGGERLDAFLARSVEGLTRSAAQRLLEEGAVTSGGRPLKKSERPPPGRSLRWSSRSRSRWTSSPRTSLWTWCTRTAM